MKTPLVSVVIPVFNQAKFLGEAIHSVLSQSYKNIEVIVVNDASPDNTDEVVKHFDDPRLKYVVHKENCGLPTARNTGIQASLGDMIALLDSDDFFHPDKLSLHAEFLTRHPEVGVSYNGRFELNYSAKTIREMVRPPLTVSLSDFVLGYPFTPSDMVIRRNWAFQVDLFDENCVNGGEDLDFPARLALAGCKFASVDRALNYRRHHSDRRRKNLAARLGEVLRVLDMIFSDPSCPEEVIALHNISKSNNFLVYAQYALSYGEVDLGQTYIREAILLNPSLLDYHPSRLVRLFTLASIADDGVDHENHLRNVFNSFPAEVTISEAQVDWAIMHGFLQRGMRAIMWNRSDEGRVYFSKAMDEGAEIDEFLLSQIADQLCNHAHEFGPDATERVIRDLSPFLEQIGGRQSLRQLYGLYSINRAFESYRFGRFTEVPGAVFKALLNDLTYITDRGVLAIMLRSIGNKFILRTD